MNKKFLVKDLSIKKKIITDYLKDLYFENDTFVKLTALDFLSNYLSEYDLEIKLKDLYEKESNQTVIRAYEKVFNGSFKSSQELSRAKSIEMLDKDEIALENKNLIKTLNNQLKYYKTKTN